MKQKTRKCPLCKQGRIKVIGWSKYTPEIREKARKLRRQGLSFRKIQRELGIKGGPQKIKSMIEAKTE